MRNSKKLIAIAGKGGVGKSLLARAFMDYTKRKALACRAFDGDGSNASLNRFYNEVDVIDVDGDLKVSAWYENQVIPTILQPDTQLVMLDLGAGAERLFRTWCLNNEAAAVLAGESVSIALWHVLDPTLDSMSPLLDTVQLLPQVEHVIWLNLGLAKGLDVADPAGAFAAMRRESEFVQVTRNRTVLEIPPLLDSPILDGQDLAFDNAIGSHGPLTLFQRMRVKRWLELMNQHFDRVI